MAEGIGNNVFRNYSGMYQVFATFYPGMVLAFAKRIWLVETYEKKIYSPT